MTWGKFIFCQLKRIHTVTNKKTNIKHRLSSPRLNFTPSHHTPLPAQAGCIFPLTFPALFVPSASLCPAFSALSEICFHRGATNFDDSSAVSCGGTTAELELAVSDTGQPLISSHRGHPAAPPNPSTTKTLPYVANTVPIGNTVGHNTEVTQAESAPVGVTFMLSQTNMWLHDAPFG